MKVKSESEVAQSCPTLSDSMDYSLPASSAHGIFQARVLEWGAIMWSQMWKICISSSIYCLSVYDYMKTIGISFPDSLLGSCLVCDCQAPIPSTVVPKEWPILSAEHAHHWWRPGFDPWVGKIPWRRAWQPTPVFLPGESHGQRSLVGYSPWGHKESDTTEWLSTAQHIIIFKCLTDKTLRYKTVLHPLQSLLYLGTTRWSLWSWCLSLAWSLLWTWTQALLLVL